MVKHLDKKGILFKKKRPPEIGLKITSQFEHVSMNKIPTIIKPNISTIIHYY